MNWTMLVLLVVMSEAAPPSAWDALLAAKALPGGWKQVGDTRVFDKSNVFDLIDGEAELYFPYGFKRVVAIDYIRGDDPNSAIAAEVYEMGSLLDAFGVYSNYRGSDSKIVEVGAEGFVGSTQAMFYQDRYFLKVRAHKMEIWEQDIPDCARALSAVLGKDNKKPDELRWLALPEIEQNSIRYVAESLLGYQFFPRGLLGRAKAADASARVFVIMPKAGQNAGAIIAEYEKYLKENGTALLRMNENMMAATDPLHKGTLMKVVGERIVGVTGLAEPASAEPLLKALAAINR